MSYQNERKMTVDRLIIPDAVSGHFKIQYFPETNNRFKDQQDSVFIRRLDFIFHLHFIV